MAYNSTYKLIELIVNAIDGTIYIDSITQIGATSRYTITTRNTKWLNVGRSFEIGIDIYSIVDIIPNTSFIIELTQGQIAPTASSFILPLPDFRHGTFNFVNQERTEEQNTEAYTDITPFIYFNEPSNDRVYKDELDARDRDASCDIYFMHEANFEDWSNETHYYYAVNAMENLIQSFIQSAENSSFVSEVLEYNNESHVKWGVISSNGHTRNLFNENLSGKRLNITLTFLKQSCSFDAYTPPREEGTAYVENSDQSYTAEVQTGDTLVLPDTTINVYVDGNLQDTTTFPTLSNETINIEWQ